ncbi:MAG: gliding motility-associated ABC transporter substrate-binding protein GldG [Mangrovibacterium sp.]
MLWKKACNQRSISLMYSLIRKEFSSFFGGITGYLIALVFLLGNGLFLWVFPGNFNIIESGYASLSSYFSLAPWLFLFLVPALTMRLFAEEKRLDTFEILLTRPFASWQLVCAKYLAGLGLVILCLLPTLVYFFSVFQLGNPVGNWDSGAAWGAFIGLFFLAAIYVAVGVLSSSLTDNPVFAFVSSLLTCFLLYSGFDFLAQMNVSMGFKTFFIDFGISKHYESMSRGVLDSRDMLYFFFVVALLLASTSVALRHQQQLARNQWKHFWKPLGLLLLILVVGNQWFFRVDLTSEKRFSLSSVSKDKLNNLEYPIYIDLYLAGDLPSGFRQLKQAIDEKVQDMDAWANLPVRIYQNDPYDIADAEQRNQLFNQLVNIGIQPTDIRRNTDEGTSTQLIFPGAVIQYGDSYVGVNLLKNNSSLSAEMNLNNSIETLEYEFMNALQQLQQKGDQKTVAFMHGHGELLPDETYDIRSSLQSSYRVKDFTLEAFSDTSSLPDVVLINAPQRPFSEQDKFYIDQMLMRGVSFMYLVDPVSVSLDSLSRGETTIAFPTDLNVLDQLFKYGVRVNPTLVQDVECVYIPVNTSPVASQPKFTPAPWYYSPLLTPSNSHVISRNINRVKSEFVSSIDTVGQNPKIHKSVILQSSPYARVVGTPTEVSLQSINNPPARELFHTANVPTGVLLEGNFQSLFEHRPTASYNSLGLTVQHESKEAKLMVFSDGSLMGNKVNYTEGRLRTQPVGYDQYSKQTFGNKELLLNAIHYLADDSGIMQLRSRVFKLRLLDKVKLREERLFWQLLNVLFPIFVVLLFGVVFQLIRIRKYKL